MRYYLILFFSLFTFRCIINEFPGRNDKGRVATDVAEICRRIVRRNGYRGKSRERRVRDPVQTRAIRTKQKIMEAGETSFRSAGYHNVTADEIARAAGASVGSFYAYFAG